MGRGGRLSSRVDKGWFEVSGGQGVRKLTESSGGGLEGLRLSSYKSHIALRFLALIVLFVLFS